MRKIAEGETYPLPPTIDDPAVLAEIGKALATAGYAKR
jgi:propionyl-CoA synthetase